MKLIIIEEEKIKRKKIILEKKNCSPSVMNELKVPG
jgi:hypothetical protein